MFNGNYASILHYFDIIENENEKCCDIQIRIRITQGHRNWWYLSTACMWFPISSQWRFQEGATPQF